MRIVEIKPAVSSGSAALEKISQRIRHCWRLLGFSELRHRELRLVESLSLGERRFVAVVEYQASRFLLGGTSGSVVLLAQLGAVPQSTDEPGNVLEVKR